MAADACGNPKQHQPGRNACVSLGASGSGGMALDRAHHGDRYQCRHAGCRPVAARRRGAKIGWVRGSVLSLPCADASQDVVLCQFGLQFVADRSAALAQMRRVLAPGGRLGLNVYGPIEHNPAVFALAQALDRHLGPASSMTKRAEHALADPALLRTLADEAGFKRIKIVTETRTIRFASVSAYVRIQLTATPLASLLQRQPGQRLAEVVTADVAATLQPHQTAGGLAFPQEAHVMVADR